MTDVDTFLAHYGKRGMKWGVRNLTTRTEAKGVSVNEGRKARNEIGQTAVKEFNKSLPALNKKWEKVDLNDDKKFREYRTEILDSMQKHVETSIKNHGFKYFETHRFHASFQGDDVRLDIVKKEVAHEATSKDFLILKVTTTSNGLITNIKMSEESGMLEQDAVKRTEDFLAHYGKKGMRWGVRKSRPSVKVSSEEGAKTGEILKKKGKTGVRSLTNDELKTVNARRKLELEFDKQNPKNKNKVDKVEDRVKYLVGLAGTATSVYAATQTPAGKAATAKAKKWLARTNAMAKPLSIVNPQMTLF